MSFCLIFTACLLCMIFFFLFFKMLFHASHSLAQLIIVTISTKLKCKTKTKLINQNPTRIRTFFVGMDSNLKLSFFSSIVFNSFSYGRRADSPVVTSCVSHAKVLCLIPDNDGILIEDHCWDDFCCWKTILLHLEYSTYWFHRDVIIFNNNNHHDWLAGCSNVACSLFPIMIILSFLFLSLFLLFHFLSSVLLIEQPCEDCHC